MAFAQAKYLLTTGIMNYAKNCQIMLINNALAEYCDLFNLKVYINPIIYIYVLNNDHLWKWSRTWPPASTALREQSQSKRYV